MKIRIIAISKPKKPYLKEALSDYLKRFPREFKIELLFLKEERGSSPKEIIKKESQKINHLLKKEDFNVLLGEEGKIISSEKFSKLIQEKINISQNISFIIGGPWGTDKELKNKVNFVLSLSKMTFPHELSLLLLIEQIYRALEILRGSKYHK